MPHAAATRQLPPPRRLTAETLCRLSEAEHTAGPVAGGPIDANAYFLCPSLTPLWYTPSYARLEEEDRRFYNQLTGLMNIEAIGWFESTFLPALSAAAARLPQDKDGWDLSRAIERFAADEREHIQWWEQLHAQSCAAIGLPRDTRLLRIKPLGQRVMSALARRGRWVSAVFWIMLALEEHSLEIARRNMGPVATQIDHTHLQAHRDHLRDETRHVQLDWHLIDRFYATQTTPMRHMNARLFSAVLERFLLPPVRGAVQVLDWWVANRPHLAERRDTMKRELAGVGEDPEYRAMMYSRRTTPVLFALLNRHPEMRALAQRLEGQSSSVLERAVPA
ncbi:MAG: diiron oxygenase [Planctomycetota bacterium]